MSTDQRSERRRGRRALPSPQHRDTPIPNRLLVQARLWRHWTQQDVADAIGASVVSVGRWERGETLPNQVYVTALCELFALAPAALGFHHSFLIGKSGSGGEDMGEGTFLLDPTTPSLTHPLFGREAQYRALLEAMGVRSSIGASPRVALVGLPGIGKTALATALVHSQQIRASFAGILWARVGPSPDILGTFSRWGQLLGIAPSETTKLANLASWSQVLPLVIGTQRFMVVIDDAWTIDDALTFTVGGPECVYLLTTRFPPVALQFAGVGGHLEQLSELGGEASQAFLSHLVPDIVNDEAEEVSSLVRAVGGLPLALVIMGSYLRTQAWSLQPRRLRMALSRLHSTEARLYLDLPRSVREQAPGQPSATLSLQATLSVSACRLLPDALLTLQILSLFPAKPQTFSEAAACAVAQTSPDVLDQLVDAGLLESVGAGRYTLHQVIADFAAESRGVWSENELLGRFVAYYVSFVEQHRDQDEVLEKEREQIAQSFAFAHRLHRPSDTIRLATAFAPFLEKRGLYERGQTYLHHARIEAEADPSREDVLPEILLYQGRFAYKQGNIADAEARYQEGLKHARRVGQTHHICAFLAQLGTVGEKQGIYEEAEVFLQEGLALAQQHHYQRELAELLRASGALADARGNLVEAERLYLEGLQVTRELGDRYLLDIQLLNLGIVCAEQGIYERAESYLSEGLLVAQQCQYLDLLCMFYTNFAVMKDEQSKRSSTVREQRHKLTEANRLSMEGLRLARQLGQEEWVCYLLSIACDIMNQRGEDTLAERYAQEASAIAERLALPIPLCDALEQQGGLCLKRGRLREAEQIYQSMLQILPHNPLFRADATFGLAKVALAHGERDRARVLGNESLQIFAAAGYHRQEEVRRWLQNLEEEE